MPETRAPSAEGERRALFRLVVPGDGGHHYATLREHPAGPGRFTLEVRRGLVWASTERVLLVRGDADPGGGLRLTAAGASGVEEGAGSVVGDELQAFAARALGVAAERLGVDHGAFFAASHVDLGESGTLGVEASVRERSAALLEASADAHSEPLPVATAAAAPSPPFGAPPPQPVADAPPAPGEAPLAPPPARHVPTGGRPASRPVEPAPPGLLGRLMGWLRRAARATLGR